MPLVPGGARIREFGFAFGLKSGTRTATMGNWLNPMPLITPVAFTFTTYTPTGVVVVVVTVRVEEPVPVVRVTEVGLSDAVGAEAIVGVTGNTARLTVPVNPLMPAREITDWLMVPRVRVSAAGFGVAVKLGFVP